MLRNLKAPVWPGQGESRGSPARTRRTPKAEVETDLPLESSGTALEGLGQGVTRWGEVFWLPVYSIFELYKPPVFLINLPIKHLLRNPF